VRDMKQVNVRTSNEFHDWQRRTLPGRFVIQDLDTWALALSDSGHDYEPLVLIELKRSYISPKKWTPFRADLPNYMALYRLAQRARLPLWIIYFTKEFESIALFDVKSVNTGSDPWISYEETVLTPEQLKQKFDSLLRPVTQAEKKITGR